MLIHRTLPGPAPAELGPASIFKTGSSEWWIERLSHALGSRLQRYELLTRYYRGTQSLERLASEAWKESGLGAVFPHYLSANHSRLIVNGTAGRLSVLGFQLAGQVRTDTEASRIWSANEMESLSEVALTESLVKGECPVLVEPNPRDPDTPLITPQDPAEVIVWSAPGDRRIRQAAMKTWWDPDARRRFYILYLPDRIERWQDRDPGQMDRWLNRLFGGVAAPWTRIDLVPNPLGEIPIVVIPNEPLLKGSPEAEHEASLGRIDHYNRVLMEMAVTSDQLAWPQRWAKGVVDDEDVGREGVQTDSSPRTGQTRWVITESPDAEFGQFVAATIDNYVKELEQIRADIAIEAFVPYHFLLAMPSSVAPSGESFTAAEVPFVDKVRGHQRDKGTAWRSVMRLVFAVAGDSERARAMAAGRTVWMDPERRTESQHIDALGKMRKLLGVPEEAVWERIPAAPEEIARWIQMRDEASATGAATPGTPAGVEQTSGSVDTAEGGQLP